MKEQPTSNIQHPTSIGGRFATRWMLDVSVLLPNQVEGSPAIKPGGACYNYFDHHGRHRYYGAVKSTDLLQWQDNSSQLTFPRGIRHGTFLKVPGPVVRNLQNQETNHTTKP